MHGDRLEDIAALIVALVSTAAAWAEQRPEYAGIGAILSIIAKVLPSLFMRKPPPPPPPADIKSPEKQKTTPQLSIDYVEIQGFVRYFPPGSCRRLYINEPLVPIDHPTYYFARGSQLKLLIAISGGEPPFTVRTNLGPVAEQTLQTILTASYPVTWDMLDGITVWVFDSGKPQQKETYRLSAAIYGTGDVDPFAGCSPKRTGWCIDCVERI